MTFSLHSASISRILETNLQGLISSTFKRKLFIKTFLDISIQTEIDLENFAIFGGSVDNIGRIEKKATNIFDQWSKWYIL